MSNLNENDIPLEDLISRWDQFSVNNNKEYDDKIDVQKINSLSASGEDKYWSILSEAKNNRDPISKYLKEYADTPVVQKVDSEYTLSQETDKNKTLYSSKEFEKLENLKVKLHTIIDKLNYISAKNKSFLSIESKINRLSKNIDSISDNMTSKKEKCETQ